MLQKVNGKDYLELSQRRLDLLWRRPLLVQWNLITRLTVNLKFIENLLTEVIFQHCGIYAGDEDSYTDFAEVFDPLICEYHGLPKDFKHTSDMDVSKIVGNIHPEAPVHSVR